MALAAACWWTPPAAAAGWEVRGIGGGGALYSVTISPHDPDLIYMTTDMGSVFKSTDFGRHWQALPFDALTGGVNTHVRFTSDPAVLYSIRVGGDDRRTPVVSTDGGRSWNALASDPTDGEAYALFADPSSTQRVVVNDYQTVYFSSNGGATFTSAYATADQDGGINVAGVFFDGQRIFLGTRDGLVVSTDGGATFARDQTPGIPAGEAMSSFAGAKEAGSVRLWAVTMNAADVWTGVTGADHWGFRGVYRLDWGGATWTAAKGNLGSDDLPFFIAAPENDIDTIFLAGGDGASGAPAVYRSDDGGQVYQRVFRSQSNENIATGWCGSGGDLEWWWAETALGFAVAPTDGNRAVLTDFGFVHVTGDRGGSWRQAYVDPAGANPAGRPTPQGRAYATAGVEDTSVWWLHWTDPQTITAAFTDISGLRSADGGATWASLRQSGLEDNSTYQIVESPATHALYAATSSVHDLYQSTYLDDDSIDGGSGRIMVSHDAGASWSTLHDFGHPVVWLAFDPANAETLYASVVHSTEGGIYVTHDLSSGTSSSWRRLAAPPRTEGHPFVIRVLGGGVLAASYSGRRDAGGAFTESSGVFLSTDGGQSWEDRSAPGMRRWTKDLVIDPHDSSQETWYAAVFSHWGAPPNEVGGVYRTTDRGAHWTRISNLYRANSVTVDPDDPQVMYASTEVQGLWRTDNLHDAAPLFQPVSDYPLRQPMRLFFNPFDHGELWAASFGGGLRVLRLSGGGCSVQCSASGPSSAAAGSAASFSASATATGCSGEPAYDWDFGDGSPHGAGASPAHTYQAAGDYTWQLSVTAGSGACSKSGTVHVTAAGATFTYLVAAIAHNRGAKGTRWRTDLALQNPSQAPVTLELIFRPRDGGGRRTAERSLGGGATALWENLLESVFGYGTGDEVSGSLSLEAPAPLMIYSRTYNQGAGGTFGQYLPALSVSEGIGAGETGWFPAIRGGAAYRTNIGVLNLGPGEVRVRIRLRDAAGADLGHAFEITVGAGGWEQPFDAFAQAGASSTVLASASLEIVSGQGPVWGYASVVDQHTGDGATVPMFGP